jgi:hypothetical protein
MPLESLVHCQTGKAQDGQWIKGQAAAQRFGQLLRGQLPAGGSGKTNNVAASDGNIRRSDVVSKLVLPCVALEEAIELDIPAPES